MASSEGSKAECRNVLLVLYWQLVTITCQCRAKPSGAGISKVPSGVLRPTLVSRYCPASYRRIACSMVRTTSAPIASA